MNIKWIRNFDMGQPEFRTFIRSLRWWQLKSSRAILLTHLPLKCLVAYGLTILFTSFSPPGHLAAQIWFPASALVTGSASGADATILIQNLMVVGEAAFLGAYLFTLLLFVRALATFDLSPMTVLRGTIYFVVGVVATLILFRAFPDPLAQTLKTGTAVIHEIPEVWAPTPGAPPPPNGHPSNPNPPSGPQTSNSTPAPDDGGSGPTSALKSAQTPVPDIPVSKYWIALAFLLGFIPDLAINQIINMVQKTLRIKTPDERFASASKSTPLELIDGIDVMTRFRLQESNIFEVQNLAVTNPVMLFVETPYGIYQVVDWVAQAQLCVAVGPERFLEFQRRSIRTIFDLERAVLSCYSTSQLRRYVAGVLLGEPPPRAPESSLTRFSGLAGKTGQAASQSRAADDFSSFAAALFSEAAVSADGKTPSLDPDESIKHLVRTMADDLHVCRLRQVWQQIMDRIDGRSASGHGANRLWDTEWPLKLPINVPQPDPPYSGR